MDRDRESTRGRIGDDSDRNAVGSGIQQTHINFDRAGSWDPSREELTDKQRIRDLEHWAFGNQRALTVGAARQIQNHMYWLMVLSGLQFIGVVVQVLLIVAILRAIP